MMASDIYRDARGRFSGKNGATLKQSGDRHFIRLFGKWAELKPVTPESIRESMRRYDRAMDDARRATVIGDVDVGIVTKSNRSTSGRGR